MTNMSSYFPAPGGYVTAPPPPATHDQYNGEAHHHAIPPQCHENGRGPPAHHHQYQQMQYGPAGGQEPPYPRFPGFRIDRNPLAEGTNPHEPSPYSSYNCAAGGGVPPPQPPPHPGGPQPGGPPGLTPQQYDSCGSRGSITPPHEQQYASCKMQQGMHPHADGLPGGLAGGPPNMVGASPPPPHHQHHQMYGGPPGVTSPSPQNSSSVLYPWMRSQFGKSLAICGSALHLYTHSVP